MFSPIQQKLIDVLGNREMKVSELAAKVYEDAKSKPLSPRNSLNSAISYINYKCEVNKLPWKLETEGMGRNGATIRKVKIKWV